MDKRLIFTGGEINPTNDELNLMPDSNRKALENFATKGVARGDSYIVDGLNFTVGVSSITVGAGHVLLGGELLEVEAQVVNEVAGHVAYVVQKQTVTNNSFFERNYRDGSTHNVAEFNRGVVVSVDSIGDPDGDLVLDKADSDYSDIRTSPSTLIVSSAFTPIATGFVGPFIGGGIGGGVPFGGDVIEISSFANSTTSSFVARLAGLDITHGDVFARVHTEFFSLAGPGGAGSPMWLLGPLSDGITIRTAPESDTLAMKIWIEIMATRKRFLHP